VDAHADVAVLVVGGRLRQRGQHDGAQQDGEGGSFHGVLLVEARTRRWVMRASCIPIVEKK
jgi:hypothetical protein